MAITYKTLGQSIPSAATLTDLYTVPGATSAVISSVVICNQSATPTTVRLEVSLAGAAVTTKDYLMFDVPIGGNQVLTLELGITMATTDKLRCYATLATVSFNVFGSEVT